MDTTIQLNGPDVYKFGVKYVVEVIMDYIKKNNLDISMFDYLVPHQANANMIDEISQKI
ncbi:MAG: hypothetical protein H6766_01610 [Candidatus Peribacteria bacterium]|nr:MAG: hypothetical protein H6766_01610 [Candidatus Peribacteria bacterium]